MGFCGEMVVRRTPEKGTGGSGEGRGERTLWAVRGSFPCPRVAPPLLRLILAKTDNVFPLKIKKNYRLQNTSF